LVERAVHGRHATAGDPCADAVAPVDERSDKRVGDRSVHWLRVYGWTFGKLSAPRDLDRPVGVRRGVRVVPSGPEWYCDTGGVDAGLPMVRAKLGCRCLSRRRAAWPPGASPIRARCEPGASPPPARCMPAALPAGRPFLGVLLHGNVRG